MPSGQWPTQLILLDLNTLTVFSEEYKLRNFSLCTLLQLPATSSLFGPNILLSTLFPYIPSLVWETDHHSQQLKIILIMADMIGELSDDFE
jgi:hypothetical protein